MTLDRRINYSFECLSRSFLLAPQNIFQQPKEPQNMLLVFAPYLRVFISYILQCITISRSVRGTCYANARLSSKVSINLKKNYHLCLFNIMLKLYFKSSDPIYCSNNFTIAVSKSRVNLNLAWNSLVSTEFFHIKSKHKLLSNRPNIKPFFN